MTQTMVIYKILEYEEREKMQILDNRVVVAATRIKIYEIWCIGLNFLSLVMFTSKNITGFFLLVNPLEWGWLT